MLQAEMFTVLVVMGMGVTFAGGLEADVDKTCRTVLDVVGWTTDVGVGIVEVGVGATTVGEIMVELTLVCLLACVLTVVWFDDALSLIFNSFSRSRCVKDILFQSSLEKM